MSYMNSRYLKQSALLMYVVSRNDEQEKVAEKETTRVPKYAFNNVIKFWSTP